MDILRTRDGRELQNISIKSYCWDQEGWDADRRQLLE